MSRFLSHLASLTGVLALCAPAWAANSLTPAEQQVCRSLTHCLKIVEEHPYHSYDYAVLAEEFTRFGSKGREALVKRIGRGGVEAGHAADLVAEIGDTSMIPALRDLVSNSTGETQNLARRTLDAVSTPKQVQSEAKPQPKLAFQTTKMPICTIGQSVLLEAQKREMPFYETDIARPDENGRYRPSPVLRIPLQRSDRTHLNSAVSRIGGWLAGYEGGLVYYDAASGAPTVVLDVPIHSLQRMEPGNVASPVWAISQTEKGVTLIDARPPRPKPVATIPDEIADLRRGPDGSLYVSSASGATVRLHPDGRATSGCRAEDAS